MTVLSNEQLQHARDLGAASYLSAYVHLMTRVLDIDDSDNVAINEMASTMVEPINIATEAAWRALMGDTVGMDQTLKRFREHLDEIHPIIN